MSFKPRTIEEIASMIGGGTQNRPEAWFQYRSSSYLTKFFRDCDLDFKHDGSTRTAWLEERLKEVLHLPRDAPDQLPFAFQAIIKSLMDLSDAIEGDPDRAKALAQLNTSLGRDGFEAFYSDDRQCYLRHTKSKTVSNSSNPHRPFSQKELKKREQLINFLNKASEDELIADVLLPLFRQLGFQRITSPGHKDKALEYGKDLWVRYTLPTQHIIYLGMQVKKGKIDSAGVSQGNVAEIYNQTLMMLGHEIFDPEQNRRVLVDHAYIVAGGEITKQAKNWLGEKLDANKRSQVMFMDREDILNLFTVHPLDVPQTYETKAVDDEIPF
jgi:hypothetical protein